MTSREFDAWVDPSAITTRNNLVNNLAPFAKRDMPRLADENEANVSSSMC